jgi:hypothetical protein
MNLNSPSRMDRRRWLQLGAGVLLSRGLWPGRLRAAENGLGGRFRFVVINDSHFSSPQCPAWFERVTASIAALDPRPELCLMVGDLAEHGTQEELGPMRDVLKGLRLPFRTVIGNHDYASQTDRTRYEELLPDSLNYHFKHQGWQFVGLDTSDGVRWLDTLVQPATMNWLKDHLPKLDRATPTVLFTHFPLGAGVPNRPLNADDVLERFKEFNLVSVFNGHHHGFTERKAGATTLTTNRCCSISRGNHDGTKEKGYFVCTASDGKIQREFIEVKMEKKAVGA